MDHKGAGFDSHSDTKRTFGTSNEWAKKRGEDHTGRRSGKHLHETEHHDRMKHEVGSHPAYPAHDGVHEVPGVSGPANM